MRMTKQDQERITTLTAGLFDCQYMISRLEQENKTDEVENWVQYANDIKNVIQGIRAKYSKK